MDVFGLRLFQLDGQFRVVETREGEYEVGTLIYDMERNVLTVRNGKPGKPVTVDADDIALIRSPYASEYV
jgi:hypothetical protein